MDIFDLLTMIGGLALFLYGMHLMGDGLSKASGGRLEKILEKLTDSPLKAVLMGAGVTAVIQSSSATTVMVVGFVNSGIMKLNQAVGVIMGANIGTTVTSWLLGMTGIDSANPLIKMLKPSSFSPVLAIVGVAVLLFSQKEKKKNIASVMVGFSVLMYGMETMSNAVQPLAGVPEFTGILTKFSNPILGMLAGLILTAIIQSSSASVGILQALCATGAVSFGTALPIIMGQNIGTCITALLSSIGANKNAKRAALVHLYFNIIGTIVFMSIFYCINYFVPFAFLKDTATGFGVAMIHSIFNVAATIVLLPFSKSLVRLACMTIRDEDKPAEYALDTDDLKLLDARFLETPGLAVEQSRKAAVKMAYLSRESIELAMSLLQNYEKDVAEHVVELEDLVDHYEDQIGSYLVKISAGQLSEKDSRVLNTLLHTISDFERISDHARNIKESAQEMAEKGLQFSEDARNELRVFNRAVKDILEMAVDSFANQDYNGAKQVEPMEEVIDEVNLELRQRHISRLRQGKCTIELGFILADISTDLERVSDHCSNIAVSLLQENSKEIDAHAYVEQLKNGRDHLFEESVAKYRQQYRLG